MRSFGLWASAEFNDFDDNLPIVAFALDDVGDQPADEGHEGVRVLNGLNLEIFDAAAFGERAEDHRLEFGRQLVRTAFRTARATLAALGPASGLGFLGEGG